MRFVTELKNDLAALGTLRDWLGEGMNPVTANQAEFRATICANCPLNEKGDWWNQITSMIASGIKNQIELKTRLKLKTKFDAELGNCKACGCALPLKVHVPMVHIKANTPLDTMAKFDPHCWITHE